jgi:hypothetical protein
MVSGPLKKLERKSKNLLEFNENENNLPEPMGHSKGSAKGKVYSYQCQHENHREIASK